MFLGIDVGTGGTRAVLIDRAGHVLASHSADHAPVRSEHVGWAEQDPQDWWRAAQEAILGALKAARRRRPWHERRSRRPHRPDARLRHARRRRPRPSPRPHLGRPAHSARSRLAQPHHRLRTESSSSSPTPRCPTSPSPSSSGSASTSPRSSRKSPTSSAPRTTSASA